jgi:hypothetical protein
LIEVKRGMRDASGFFNAVEIDHDGNFDLRGADEFDVDTGFGERLKERRGDTTVRLHADANDRKLGDMFVDSDLTATDGG